MKENIRLIEYCTYKIDPDFNICEVDSKFESITGYSKSYIKRHKISQFDLLPPEDVEKYKSIVFKNVAESGEAYIEHRIKRKDGEIIYVFCLGKKTEDGSEIRVTRVDASLNMLFIEELYKNKINDLELVASLDNLTNLLRRDPFIEAVNELIDGKRKFALIIIDIDDFKSINDTYGHNIGDEILVKVSKIFKKIVKTNGFVSRLGGDEFAICYRYKDEKELIELSDKLVNKIAKNKYKMNMRISVSVGIAKSEDGTSFEQLYVKADEALYESKKNGKNRYTIVK